MKRVHLFWTPGDKRLSSLKMGWLDLRYHLLSWVLSACSIRRCYPQLELIADEFGAEILAGKLQLPYTRVRTDYEGLDLGYPDRIWAAKKMYGYTLHQEPFVNFDGDVFLWEALPQALVKAPLFAQNLEVNVPFYLSAIQDIKRHFNCIPDFLRKADPAKAPVLASNAGILGANDLDFIKTYVDFGFDFLNKNLHRMEKVNQSNQNIIIEQYFFYELARQSEIPIAHLIEEPTTSRQFPHMTNFTALPEKRRYIHIMGGKKYPSICEQLEQRVRLDFPDAYFRTLELIRKQSAETLAFFFSRQEEEQALQSEGEVSGPSPFSGKWIDHFPRTREVLNEMKIGLRESKCSDATHFKGLVLSAAAGKRFVRSQAAALREVVRFEYDRYVWLQNLPPLSWIEARKRNNTERINRIMNLPMAERNACRVKLNELAFIWDSEWNWAEKKEFKNQVENRNPFRKNGKLPPSFFRTLGFVYPQQGIVREYLADPMSILLIDVLAESELMPIGELLHAALAQARAIAPEIGDEYGDELLDKFSFLAYQWTILADD